MLSLGELSTLLPVAGQFLKQADEVERPTNFISGGQVTLSGRFVDPALAFAMGWNYWY
jgi:amino acid transporter